MIKNVHKTKKLSPVNKINRVPITEERNTDRVNKREINLIFSNDGLPPGLHPNMALTAKMVQKYFGYSTSTLQNWRDYFNQDIERRIGPRFLRYGIQGIKYLVSDIIRFHQGLPWLEPYPQQLDAVRPKKKEEHPTPTNTNWHLQK